MAKDKLSDWDTVAANNTDIGSISLAENVMRPPAVNNAMREHMSQVAGWLGSDTLASATTTDLGSVEGQYVSVTGTTTITGLGTIKAGIIKFVKFAGILTLTHNATSLILPTGASITTAAGDTAAFASEGSGNWRCLGYSRASGAALAGSTAASTTDVLTGTDASKAVTSDALAALWEKGIDVTAAATLTLGEGKLFNVVGNTTITDIDFAVPADGREATLIFEGAPLLTHNATTLNLPGAGNIQVVAGDRCDIVQDDADNIFVTNYTRATGAPLIPPSTSGNVLTSNGSAWVSSAPAAGGMTLLGTIATTSGTTKSLTNIPAGYRQLYIEFDGVSVSSTATIDLALSSTNGGAYGTAKTITQSLGGSDLVGGFVIIGNVSSAVAAAKSALAVLGVASTATVIGVRVNTNTAADVDAIQISSGANFDAGEIRVYGVK